MNGCNCLGAVKEVDDGAKVCVDKGITDDKEIGKLVEPEDAGSVEGTVPDVQVVGAKGDLLG